MSPTKKDGIRAMTNDDNRALLDHNAHLLLTWRSLWPPSHDDERSQSDPCKGPWEAIPKPERCKPMAVSREEARILKWHSILLRERYLPDDRPTLVANLAEFMQLAFPEAMAAHAGGHLGAWISRCMERATERDCPKDYQQMYWPVLAAIGGDDFDRIPHVDLWLQIRYLGKDTLMERLIQGVNVTLRNPWLAVLTNTVDKTLTYSSGQVIHSDNLGERRIK
jgi:hypothetical protein